MTEKKPHKKSGPLADVKVLEFAGIGPAPFACMLFSDWGADVVRVERAGAVPYEGTDPLTRGRSIIALDLKCDEGRDEALQLAAKADIVIESYRPGVMERLGLGPDRLLSANPALIFGRMTGWGQDGPLATTAGHDINYISLCGALHSIGNEDQPLAPLNLVGDFGGGALYLVAGALAALHHARATGQGQVVDTAVSDCTASLMTMFFGMNADGAWSSQRRTNAIDGGAPFYDTYRCSDNGWLSVGPLEDKFFLEFCNLLSIPAELRTQRHDKKGWRKIRQLIAAKLAAMPRSHWESVFAGSDACVTPVLDMAEAPAHPHNIARSVFIEVDGVTQPAPAPRYSATPCTDPSPPALNDTTMSILDRWTASNII